MTVLLRLSHARLRHAAAVGALTVALGACLAGVATAGPAARCLTANLRVDKVGENDFTSHRSWDIALRNVSASTCQLSGFPRVTLLNGAAKAEPTSVRHVQGPPHAVVLGPWKRAFFSFTFATNGPCSAAVFASGVRVLPPHATRGLVWYPGPFGLCGPAPAVVSVSPVMSSPPF